MILPEIQKELGNRSTLAALRKIYKRGIAGSSPLYSTMETEGNKIRLHFRETGGGLVAKDGVSLKGFAISGTDKKWL